MRKKTTNCINSKRLFCSGRYKSVIYIAILCIVALLLSTKGITDEGTVSLQGDPPHHMMNGVYFYDLIRDFPFTNPIEYTLQYFARYPALSLGHQNNLIITLLFTIPTTLPSLSISAIKFAEVLSCL